MDHHQGSRCLQNLRACHGDNGCCGSCDAIDLDGHIVLVIHQHGVDLACRDAVTARGIEPYSDRAFSGEKLIVEHLRRDIIVKPGSLRDGAVEFKNPFRPFVCLVLPFPELLLFLHGHPPFLLYLHKLPLRKLRGAYCR